jgi:hypothetical protein
MTPRCESPTPICRRFWPRFTLRVLLAIMTALCIGLAWWTQRAREQKRIAEQIRLSGGGIVYDFDAENTPNWIASKSPMWSAQLVDEDFDGEIVDDQSTVPRWLLDRLGVDFFHTIIQASVSDCDELREIDSLSYVQELHAGHGVNDEDIRHVARLRRLKRFVAGTHGKLSVESLHLLARMPSLEVAILEGEFSAEGLAALASSPSLREVTVSGCDDSVDLAVVEVFRKHGRVHSLWLQHETTKSLVLRDFWGHGGPSSFPPVLGYGESADQWNRLHQK